MKNHNVFVLGYYDRALGVSYTVGVVSDLDKANTYINDQFEDVVKDAGQQWAVKGGYVIAVNWAVE